MDLKINRNWWRPILYLTLGLVVGYFLFRGGPSESTSSSIDGGTSAEVWTCSMHPQIRQPEPGLCPICEMDLIPASGNEGGDPLVFQMTEEARKLAQLRTELVGGSEGIESTIQLNGIIREDERRIYHQVTHFPGRIEALNVQFTGEEVKKGQLIATLYSPELVQAQRELLEARKLGREFVSLAEAAREKLRSWKVSEEDIKTVEQTGEIIDHFPVYADQSGIVRKRLATQGDYVGAGFRLYELVDLQKVWVLFDAYEQDLAVVRVGDRISFETPSAPGKQFTGRIQFIDPQLDGARRVASLRVEQSNPGSTLKPGMFVKGTLEYRDAGGGKLTIPRSAVLWTGKRSVVWVERTGGNAPEYEYREVVLGQPAGDHYEIRSGLAPGDRVVIQGAFTLDAAAQLNNQSSMINGLLRSDVPAAADYEQLEGIPLTVRTGVNDLIVQYIGLKDALVSSSPELARAASLTMRDALVTLDLSDLPPDAREFIKSKQDEMQEPLTKMGRENDLEAIRNEFAPLSVALIDLALKVGVSGQHWYVQHCPMAINNEGADWISEEAAIRNPYFGDRMLKCGVVRQQIGEK